MANLNRLKVVLAEQQKTGKWLAEQIGKSNCTVSKWCSNSVQPDLKTLNDIYGAQNETYIEGWEKKTSNLLIYKRMRKV